MASSSVYPEAVASMGNDQAVTLENNRSDLKEEMKESAVEQNQKFTRNHKPGLAEKGAMALAKKKLKKIQKLDSDNELKEGAESKVQMNQYLRIGLIIMIVGLILSLLPIFWYIGGVIFVVGLIIALYGLLLEL
ncbi:MAG: hypothetical protein ACK4ND_14215 [Cytophagaceae bacterium]